MEGLGRALLAAVVVASLASCERGGGPNPAAQVITEAQARAVLEQSRQLALKAKDAHTFCAGAIMAETCTHDWDVAGGKAGAPRAAPRILRSWVDGEDRVLVICGTDGLDKTYKSDFPVVRSGSGAHITISALLPVFWYGSHYSGSKNGTGPAVASADSVTPSPETC